MSRWCRQGLLVMDRLLWEVREVPVHPKNVKSLHIPMNGAGAGCGLYPMEGFVLRSELCGC